MPIGENTSSKIEQTAAVCLDSMFEVYRRLGPGLLESVYARCLAYEIEKRGLAVCREVPVRVVYDNLTLDGGFRIDLLVEDEVIIELKSCESLLPIHEAQVLTYLKLAKKRLALLVNFNARLLKDQIKRIIL
jgi:GxxExxY protein